jgi:energy-coupling factor transporter ATP-binding protein EcfA2
VKIVQLTAENVKRLKAVQITPEGNLVVIGGKNGAGKSSVLDSISMALGGGRLVPGKPVRDGEGRGQVICDLGDLVVKRTFTAAGNTALSITDKEGRTYKSPQKLLDAMNSRLTFDPLEFSRMDKAAQARALQDLLGEEFNAAMAEIDEQIQVIYDTRADINRDIKRLGESEPVEPVERVDVSAVLAEKEEIEAFNAEQDRRALDIAKAKADLEAMGEEAEQLQAQIQELQLKLSVLENDREHLRQSLEQMPEPAPPKPLNEVNAKLAGIDETNRRAAAYEAYQNAVEHRETLKAQSDAKTEALAKLRQEREELFASAAFPVEGLGLEDGKVTLNGLPFDQASSAEQLRVSVAMGLAMNPKLKVLLIRDGSLLDPDSLKMVAEMAAEADAQVWVERVSEGEECQIVIEDGEVRLAAPEALPSAPEPEPDSAPAGDGGLFPEGAGA